MNKDNEIKVFISLRDSTCGECGEDLGSRAWITLQEEKGAVCLSCADLEHLVYLPSGDPALTRRAKKYSKLWAVVLKWSRARKRYERQGLLVEDDSLTKAEQECLADADARERRRKRQQERAALLDKRYIIRFSDEIIKMYPMCPPERAKTIAEHACVKHSGRVGRSSAAKAYTPEVIHLAVAAHIRHTETEYDDLLLRGYDRFDARLAIKEKVNTVIDKWSGS